MDKQKLIQRLAAVSQDDFQRALERWMSGFNADSMIENFISILEDYI